ncbi:hypothetical protein [Mesorhizobium sp.]|uniref:hypothetical protein n=1 Tax=Mesorhizobium sp. TaxID=1871066 RepID=UPI003BA8D21C
MDSLKIQDAFEPYYVGRRRFAASADKARPAHESQASKSPTSRLPSEIRLSTETDSTTEH